MLNDKLRLNVSVNSNTQNYTTTGDGSSFNRGVYSAALVTNPTLPIYKQDVNKDVLSSMPEYDGPWAQPSALVAIANPLSTIETANGRHHRQRTRLNGNVTFQPIESLKFNALLSWDRYYETRGYRETLIISIPQWLIPVTVLPPEVLVRLQTSCLNLPLSIVKFLAFIIFLYWEVMAIRRIYGRIIGCGTGIFLQTSLAGIISL